MRSLTIVPVSKYGNSLTLSILDTGNHTLCQTVKIQMNAALVNISSGSALFANIKQSSRTKIHYFVEILPDNHRFR